jgi:hypothetical protein
MTDEANNQSPETEDVEPEGDGLDLDKWWEEKEQGLLAKLGIGDKSGEAPPAPSSDALGDANESGTKGGASEAAIPASSESSAAPPASPSDDRSLAERIKAGVAEALASKDHDAHHAALSEPAPERPKRKGIGKMIWGA